MQRVLIDKETLIDKIRANGDPLNAGKMWKLILTEPEIKRSEQIRCKDCARNGTDECPFDKRVLRFRDDERFYCCLAKRKRQ